MSDQSSTDRPSIAEIAALTARLRELSNAGAAADAAERAEFLASKDALIDRIAANDRAAGADESRTRASAAEGRAVHELLGRDEITTAEPAHTDDEVLSAFVLAADEAVAGEHDRMLTAEEAVEVLQAHAIALGVPPDHAPAAVKDYLLDLAERQGMESATDGRPLDAGDGWWVRQESLSAEVGLTGAEGPPIDAGPALTAEEAARDLAADGRSIDEARALVSGYLDDISHRIGASAHLWGLDDADLAAIRAEQRAPDAVTALPAAADNRTAVRGETGAPQLHEHNAILNRANGEDARRHADYVDDPWDGYRTYTPSAAAAELVVRGIPPDAAPGVVDRYLDGLTRERGWSPQDQWEIDDDDLTEMTAAPESPTTAPPRPAQARAHTRGRTTAGETEQERRAQLAAWHSAAHIGDARTTGDDASGMDHRLSENENRSTR